MSWLYVPASGESNLAFIELGALELSATLRKTLGAWLQRLVESGTVYSVTHQFGTTLKPLTVSRGVESWIASLRVSRASQSPSQESNGELKTNGGSGLTCGELFAKFDPESSSWKTCQELDGKKPLKKYLKTWPQAGTMRSGIVWLLKPLERPTSDGEHSLYPTPRAQDSYERSNWKTVVDANEGGSSQQTLTRKIRYDAGKGGGQLNPTWVEWLMGFPIGWTVLEPLETP